MIHRQKYMYYNKRATTNLYSYKTEVKHTTTTSNSIQDQPGTALALSDKATLPA